MRQSGLDIISLSVGELDFDTPAHIAEAGQRAIADGRTRYTSVAGIEELREAIARKVEGDCGERFGLDEITVGCGAKQILFNALLATLDPGDEVVVPVPCWPSYPEMVKLAGGSPVLVSCREADGLKLTPAALERAVTPRTKWLLLNNPNNPTGALYSRSELHALGEVLRRRPHVGLLADEIYSKLVYEPDGFQSTFAALPSLRDRLLVVDGVSKCAAMTGWRIGYGVGPKWLVSAMNLIQGQTTSNASSIAQHAALAALAGPQDYVHGFVDELRARRDLAAASIAAINGLSCSSPDGAFYLFVNCGALLGRQTPDGVNIHSDASLALQLLESALVAVVPGESFGASPYFRLSYACSRRDLGTAFERIRAFCAGLE